MVLIAAGRHEEALVPLRRATELGATMLLPQLYLGVTLNHLGRSEEAIAILELAAATSGRSPFPLAGLAVSLSSLGRAVDAQAICDELVARSHREYIPASMLALATGAAGQMDEAFQLLHRSIDDREGIAMFYRRYPAFRQLQLDARMAEIYRRIGRPD